MDIRSHRERLRSSAPTPTNGSRPSRHRNIRASQPVSLKSGLLRLEDVSVPQRAVQPGDPFTVRIRVRNLAATVLNIDDADACGLESTACSTGSFGNGYCTVVDIEGDWGESFSAGPRCVGDLTSGDTVEVFEKDVVAPEEEGNHRLDVRLYLPGSGEESVSIVRSVAVSPEAPSEPPETPDPAPPGGGGGGGGFQQTLGEIQATLLLLGVFAIGIRAMG